MEMSNTLTKDEIELVLRVKDEPEMNEMKEAKVVLAINIMVTV